MDAADPGEDEVARPDRVDLAVELELDLASEEEVGLLERVVVGLGRPADLVVDREHRQQVGAEVAIDEHLHRDPAVDEQGDVHADRLPPVGRIADAECLRLRRGSVVMADKADRRVAEPRSNGARDELRRVEVTLDEERVTPAGVGGQALRRPDRQPADLGLAAVRKGVPDPDGKERVVAGDESVDGPPHLDDELTRQDVQPLLEGVDMAAEPAAWRECADGQLGVDGPLLRADEDLPGQPRRPRGWRCGAGGERPIDAADVMHD